MSRTDPSAAKVAKPTPEADVTLVEPRLASGGVGLDLRGDPIALTAALVDIPSESRDEQQHRRRGRGSTARADQRVRDRPHRQHRAGPHRPRPAVAGHPGRTPRHRADRRQCAQPPHRWRASRLRHVGHEVRRRGVPAPGRHSRRPRARHHADHVRLRGDRGVGQQLGPHRARAAGVAARRRRDPRGAVGRVHRGGLSGHAANGRDRRQGRGRIQRDRGWATTRFTSWARCSTG